MSLHIIPVVGTIGYLYYPSHLRLDPEILFYMTLIHNAGLIAFSAWTFLTMTNILLVDGVVFYFYLSKYYEYTDTFLIYLGGKKPIFLQKYHHIGTAILWHFAYYYKGDAIWIPTFYNSFVHTVMYSYYLGCLLKIKSFKMAKPYITGLQIFQLVSQFSTLYYYKPPVDTIFNYWIAIISNIFTLGLLILFCQFYYTNYRVPKLREH